MKKMVCGILVTVIGLCFSSLSLIYALVSSDGIPSIYSSLYVTDTLGILCISIITMLWGLSICVLEAYKGTVGNRRDNEKDF